MTSEDFYLEVIQPLKHNRYHISVEDEGRIIQLGRRFDSKMFFKYDYTSPNKNVLEDMFTKACSKIYHTYYYLSKDDLNYLKSLI